MSPATVGLILQRIGPYHDARFEAAARVRPLSVIEFRTDDTVYAWAPVEKSSSYDRRRANAASLEHALSALSPEVLVCVGYSDPEVHRAMRWALRSGVPLVTCSDSTALDEPRRPLKEALKRQVVRCFSAGLAAGERATAYLGSLGLESSRVFRPWDVVDNDYFARAAAALRVGGPARDDLPEQFFLCVARFVAKKNLLTLVEAYARYAQSAGEHAWGLVFSGSGELEGQLREFAEQRGVAQRVRFTGFRQYGDLPALYARAQALVLPSVSDQWGLVVNEAMASGLPVLVSERCGCVPELVRENETGHVLDPTSAAQVAAVLERFARTDAAQRASMGRRAAQTVASFTPDAFAQGLWAAADHARSQPRRVGVSSRLAISALVALGS
jgi:glycosyltransferase involved in cell wall biosynthesis